MHTDTEIQLSVDSLTNNIQGRISRLATRMQRWITSLVKKAKKAMVFDRSAHWIHDTIPPAAVLAGAAAFGFWWDSVRRDCIDGGKGQGVCSVLLDTLATLHPKFAE